MEGDLGLRRRAKSLLSGLEEGVTNGTYRFYAADICLALTWIHGNNMIYRALSLDHTLLGSDGHVKFVDFVVSKVSLENGSRTKTFCGQMEFMAPEVSCKLVM